MGNTQVSVFTGPYEDEENKNGTFQTEMNGQITFKNYRRESDGKRKRLCLEEEGQNFFHNLPDLHNVLPDLKKRERLTLYQRRFINHDGQNKITVEQICDKIEFDSYEKVGNFHPKYYYLKFMDESKFRYDFRDCVIHFERFPPNHWKYRKNFVMVYHKIKTTKTPHSNELNWETLFYILGKEIAMYL